MKAVILCGGRGTRMREETEFRPKPLVEIGGMPILWHIMKIYAHYGVNDFVLCLGYKGHMIKQFFLDLEVYNKDVTYNPKTKKLIHHYPQDVEDWNITFAETGQDSLTGSRIKQIEKYIDEENFYLTYGDGVSDINLKDLLAFHLKQKKIGTVTAIRPIARFGALSINNGVVVDFTKKNIMHGNRVDGGYFVFNRRIFDYLSLDKNCALEDEPLKNLAKDNQFVAYSHSGFWQCMDIPQHLDYLNEVWNKNEAPWKKW
ncbi:MAG TPA: glucose-1-phosphate cytidylyltransferase [Candidatus Nanoarchaeia archaeon]|nr:glucose-1-phosphate cytidylyltransferase [Candidatus Nanoarchaeia archaeon]